MANSGDPPKHWDRRYRSEWKAGENHRTYSFDGIIAIETGVQKKKFYRRPLLSTRGFLYTKHLRVYTLMNRLNEIFIGKIGWSQKLSTHRANPPKIVGGWGKGGGHLPFVRFTNILFGETRPYQKVLKWWSRSKHLKHGKNANSTENLIIIDEPGIFLIKYNIYM